MTKAEQEYIESLPIEKVKEIINKNWKRIKDSLLGQIEELENKISNKQWELNILESEIEKLENELEELQSEPENEEIKKLRDFTIELEQFKNK